MSVPEQDSIAARIRTMARERHVAYIHGPNDALAQHITRLADGEVAFGEIEKLLIALQRDGYLSRAEMVQLQVAYLREIKSSHVDLRQFGADL
jgi:hypothetical protein